MRKLYDPFVASQEVIDQYENAFNFGTGCLSTTMPINFFVELHKIMFFYTRVNLTLMERFVKGKKVPHLRIVK